MFHDLVKPARRLLLGVLLVLAATPVLAQGNILIQPGRVLLNGSARSAELTLVNTGEMAVTYRIELFDQRMTADGGLERVDEPAPEDRSAKAMIRFSPRQITLDGGGRQAVRLFLRKPAGLEPGEYRSHLLLRALPQADAENDVEAGDGNGEKLTFQVKIAASLSIPVIVRHGDVGRRVSLSQANLESGADSADTISVRLHREGDGSVYGDLVAVWTPDRGKEIEVARLGGVAIYPPLTELRYSMPVRPPEGEELADGHFTVRFASHPVLDAGVSSEAAEIAVH